MPITLVIYNFGCMHLTVAIEVEPIVAINQNKLCLFTDEKADNYINRISLCTICHHLILRS